MGHSDAGIGEHAPGKELTPIGQARSLSIRQDESNSARSQAWAAGPLTSPVDFRAHSEIVGMARGWSITKARLAALLCV